MKVNIVTTAIFIPEILAPIPKAKLFKLSAKANVIASLNSIFPEPLISAV